MSEATVKADVSSSTAAISTDWSTGAEVLTLASSWAAAAVSSAAATWIPSETTVPLETLAGDADSGTLIPLELERDGKTLPERMARASSTECSLKSAGVSA